MMPRISMMISPITSSATLRVLEKGALNTGMPRLRAERRSTWLVPMQKQPTAIRRSAASSTGVGELGAAANAEHVDAAEGIDQRGPVERGFQAGDVVVAGLGKPGDGAVMHAFEQQDPDVLLIWRQLGGWGQLGGFAHGVRDPSASSGRLVGDAEGSVD